MVVVCLCSGAGAVLRASPGNGSGALPSYVNLRLLCVHLSSFSRWCGCPGPSNKAMVVCCCVPWYNGSPGLILPGAGAGGPSSSRRAAELALAPWMLKVMNSWRWFVLGAGSQGCFELPGFDVPQGHLCGPLDVRQDFRCWLKVVTQWVTLGGNICLHPCSCPRLQQWCSTALTASAPLPLPCTWLQ